MKFQIILVAIAGFSIPLLFRPEVQPAKVHPAPSTAIAPSVVSPKPQHRPKPKTTATSTEPMSRTGIPGLTMRMEWRLWRAYLRTIYWAEGTLHEPDPYNTQFTFAKFQGFQDHPRIIRCAGDLCSDASGAGQWLSTTYDAVKARNKGRFWANKSYFSPENQDLAMLYHLAEIGTARRLLAGVSVAKGKVYVNYDNFVAAAINNCPVWASWPSNEHDSSGCYGQGAKTAPQLWKVFQEQLAKEQGS